MEKISKTQFAQLNKSLIDPIGSVFFYKNGVYRAIFDENYSVIYRDLLNSPLSEKLFRLGLIHTEIADNIKVEGAHLVLQHERVPFFLHPSEYTNEMFWEAAKSMLTLMKELAMNGYVIKDGNAFNITFNNFQPVFIDFTSIIKKDRIPANWTKVFLKYFGVPLWLASKKKFRTFSTEYRREHHRGFGLRLFESKRLQQLIFREILKLKPENPIKYVEALEKWVDKHKPYTVKKEYWSNYEQHHSSSITEPKTIKQKFIFKILENEKPLKVLDVAANKGYYAHVASHLGAQVMAFDYEEWCVDQCLEYSKTNNLNITPAIMNFFLPTTVYGWGGVGENAYSRFNSDIVLALGIIHHVCSTQKLPVKLFCDICKSYAEKGIIIEFIEPADFFFKGKKIPEFYSIEYLTLFLNDKFPNLVKSERITRDGISRIFLYYHK